MNSEILTNDSAALSTDRVASIDPGMLKLIEAGKNIRDKTRIVTE